MGLLVHLMRRAPTTRALVASRPFCRPLANAVAGFSTPPVPADDAKNVPPNEKKASNAEVLTLLPATLEAFYARHGHYLMSYNFTVHVDEDTKLPPYPLAVRGRNVGIVLTKFLANPIARRKRRDVVEALEAIDFPVHENWKQLVWERLRVAPLQVYREIYGHSVVSRSFIVPTDDPRWPIETRGLRLGTLANNLRRRDYKLLTQDQLDQLDALGFVWDVSEAQWSTKVLPAMEAYFAHHGNLNVPMSFRIPDDEAWPQALRGYALGVAIANMRYRNDHLPFRLRDAKRLEKIGFEAAMKRRYDRKKDDVCEEN